MGWSFLTGVDLAKGACDAGVSAALVKEEK